MRRFAATLVLVALFALGLAPAATAATPVLVPGSAGWVSSGVTVTGEVSIGVRTLGYVVTAQIPRFHVPGVFKSASGPAGQSTYPTCGDTYATFSPDLQAQTGPCALDSGYFGELIGRVGVDGAPFVVGDTTTITPPASGILYFAVDDLQNTYGDNLGAFTVLFP
jgi:hypothetical protein